jgi:hypothetical protein
VCIIDRRGPGTHPARARLAARAGAARGQRRIRPRARAAAQEAGLAEQRTAFEFFDRNRDARVTLDDFAWAMEQLGLTGEGTVGLTKARTPTLGGCAARQHEAGAFRSFSVVACMVSYVPFATRRTPFLKTSMKGKCCLGAVGSFITLVLTGAKADPCASSDAAALVGSGSWRSALERLRERGV